MLQEDKDAQIRREYFRNLEEKFAEIQDMQPDYSKKEFSLQPNLPGRYDNTFTDKSRLFEEGTGIDNEDELEDIREAQQRALEEEQRKEAERKRLYEIEMQKRMDEAAERTRREEMDRRLAENTERRRLLREHIDDLKKKRRSEANEALRKAEEDAHLAALQAAQESHEMQVKQHANKEADDLKRDREDMCAEYVLKRDYDVASGEISRMEHEDILSYMAEKAGKDKAERAKARLEFLQEVYTEHVPFQFKRSTLRVPAVHSVLSDDMYYNNESVNFEEGYASGVVGADGTRPMLATSASLQDFVGSSVYHSTGPLQQHPGGDDNPHGPNRRGSLSLELADLGITSDDFGSGADTYGSNGGGGEGEGRSSLIIDDPIMGHLSVDQGFVRAWVKGVSAHGHHDSPLRGHLMKGINDRTSYTPEGHSTGGRAERRKTIKARSLKATDQKPVLWKGLSEEAMRLLVEAKLRHDRATGGSKEQRPYTSGTVLQPISYTLKDRDTRVAENRAAAAASRPRSEMESMNPNLVSPVRRVHTDGSGDGDGIDGVNLTTQRPSTTGAPAARVRHTSGADTATDDQQMFYSEAGAAVTRVPQLGESDGVQGSAVTHAATGTGMHAHHAAAGAGSYQRSNSDKNSNGRRVVQVAVPDAPLLLEHSQYSPTVSNHQTVAQAHSALSETLSKSMEIASIVMQRSRMESTNVKSLTLASISANDNYDRGKRRQDKKPKNAHEARNEPKVVVQAIKDTRLVVNEYVGGQAIMHDKFYLQTCEPGIRDRDSLDDSVRKFMAELKADKNSAYSLDGLGDDDEGEVGNGDDNRDGGDKEEGEGETKGGDGDSRAACPDGSATALATDGDEQDNSRPGTGFSSKRGGSKKSKRTGSADFTALDVALGRAVEETDYHQKQLAALKNAVKRNLKGKPNDPTRFEGKNAKYSGKHSDIRKGFGVLGGTIDIAANGFDPRLTGIGAAADTKKQKKSMNTTADKASSRGGTAFFGGKPSIKSNGDDFAVVGGGLDDSALNLQSQSQLSPIKGEGMNIIGTPGHLEQGSVDSLLSTVAEGVGGSNTAAQDANVHAPAGKRRGGGRDRHAANPNPNPNPNPNSNAEMDDNASYNSEFSEALSEKSPTASVITGVSISHKGKVLIAERPSNTPDTPTRGLTITGNATGAPNN
jgi:hypothetical protein